MNRVLSRIDNTEPVGNADPVGARLARDKAGRDKPDICGGLIAGKPRSHRVAWCVLLALLTGCKTHLDPVSYSPNYQALTRADGRVEMIPAECLKPPAEDQFGTDEEDYVPLLPPGCANNLTLLQMVEQRSDLMQGRQSGPTMAAPVGRAAQVYIDGYDREELRRRQAEQQNKADSQEGGGR